MHGTIHLNLSIELYNQMTVCYSAKKKKKEETGPGVIICQDSQVPPVETLFIKLHCSVAGH